MKALVYRIGGLGDSLLIYPILEVLSNKGYEITVWGNPEYFRLAENVGFCKKALIYEPRETFDLRIIFSKNKELFSGDSIYIDPIPTERVWVVDYYLKKLGFKNERFSKVLPVRFSVTKQNSLCIVHPGSGSKKKNPEPIFFLKLEDILKEQGYDVFYLLGPAEGELIKTFKNSIYLEDTVEIAKVLLKASLYIGLDSGISHLSSYLGIPSVVIFGPTDSNIWRPIGDKLWIIRDEACRPCFPNVCKERRCLQPEFLLDKVKSLQICQRV